MRSLSNEQIEKLRQRTLDTIKNKTLTHEQKVAALANCADSFMTVLDMPEELIDLMDEDSTKKIICDLAEGNAPIRPRYIIPDYEKFMREGSKFLQLDPPRDIYEAVNSLLIFYRHVPSVTNFPVYLGNLDYLLDPFIDDEEEARKAIRLFLINIDRTVLDSFAHADLGPIRTRAGELIMEISAELKNAVPNITLKYDEDITPDDFAVKAIDTALSTAKPSFANHKMFKSEFGEEYVIASCYNGLRLAGGSYTLVRILLGNLAKRSEGIEDFKNNVLPKALEIMASYMDERIRFIVEESGFFESNFLALEGFIKRENFTAMYGMVGLAECVNTLLQKENIEGRYGHTKNADDLGVEIVELIYNFNNSHNNKYCEGNNGHFLLHAQVGIDSDVLQSPGCRIPIGEEPEELADHLMHCARFHRYFASGIGDIFPVDSTIERNKEYFLDIIRGSFRQGVRYISLYEKDSDVVRVTGYLVKRSELKKLAEGKNVLQDTTALGLGASRNAHALERKVR